MNALLRLAFPALVLLALDVAWLYTCMSAKYDTMISLIQKKPMAFKLHHAMIAYTCMVIGLYAFALDRNASPTTAIGRAALFGAILYGVYDFTNAAVFDDFDTKLALIDVAWGSILYAAACAASFLV